MNPIDIILSLVIAVLFVLCIVKIIRDRKKASCSCGCEGCTGQCSGCRQNR